MKKNNEIYNNPNLDDIPLIDLNENYKKIETSKKIIKILDKIKSSRKLSQNPKILEKIKSEKELIYKKISKPILRKDIDLHKSKYFSTTNIKPKMVLSIDEKNLTKVLDLHRNFLVNQNNVRRLGNKFKKQINNNTLIYLDKEKKIKCSRLDFNKLNKLESIIDIGHSSYIADINNYNIKENENEEKRCFFEFERNPITVYDPILQKNKRYNLPNLKINKWDKYSEAFILMDNKLYKKGGLFSEYIKMNKLGFQVIGKEREENVKKKMEIISQKRQKIKKIIKNFNIHSRNYFSDGNINKSNNSKRYKIINNQSSQ